jgi:uncharacterized protein YggE
VVLIVLVCLPLSIAFGQGGGLRAGLGEDGSGSPGWGRFGVDRLNLSPLSPQAAETYIAIDGRAEVRVQPTEIRVVLAVTGEAETAQKCQETVHTAIERLKTAWSKMESGPDRVVADFIVLVPRYAWSMENRNGANVAVEKRAGYRMQTNVHFAVQKESQAEAALTLAFEQQVTDIIAFDYWSKELDDVKVKARALALKAARSKADTLFSTLFRDPPPVINVQEQTTVHHPESLYHTVSSANQGGEDASGLGGIPHYRAQRPRLTYYRGMSGDGDIQPRDLPMNPEISVVSTVRLYFASPAAGNAKKKEDPASKAQ